MDVEQGNDQPDIRLAGLVVLTDMLAIEDRQPSAEHEQAGGERDEMDRIEQVEHAAGEREHRKRADAARAPGVGAGEEILEGQAEKQAQRRQAARRSSPKVQKSSGSVIMGVTRPRHGRLLRRIIDSGQARLARRRATLRGEVHYRSRS